MGETVPLFELGEKIRVAKASTQRIRRLGIARIEGLDLSGKFLRAAIIIDRWPGGFGRMRCGPPARQDRREQHGRRSGFSRSQENLRLPLRSGKALGRAAAKPRSEGVVRRPGAGFKTRKWVLAEARLVAKRMVMMM